MLVWCCRVVVAACVMCAFPSPTNAQVDQQRAQAYVGEAEALCARDAGRLWGGAICAPMEIGDVRTQTFANSRRLG